MQRLQRETTSGEFVLWMHYLAESVFRPERMDYYLAQIAMEVRCVLMKAKTRNRVKLTDFLLRRKVRVVDPERSKSVWMSWIKGFMK